ncbi:MAG TPA: response regulator transcription factor [Candidatus Eisenbacteria bacterium]|nr:response regulator transcription factor [Candidatus Eisenbacteria bacterium]
MSTARASLLLADDHAEFLAAVVRHLEPHFEILRTVGDGRMVIAEAARLVPDLIVLDISMPLMNGIEAARQLKVAGSAAKIVFLTVHADLDYVRAALGSGALGYVLKSELASDLLPCLREVLLDRSFVSPSIGW